MYGINAALKKSAEDVCVLFYYFTAGCAEVFCQLLDKWSIPDTSYRMPKRKKGVSLITFTSLVEYAQPNSRQCG
jgi:hypothetical protein